MSGTKGRCAICGKVGRLTDDHVPPKSAVPPNALDIQAFVGSLGSEVAPPTVARPGRDAPRFPTICRICNNDRLGSQYDPSLVRFCNGVATWVRASSGLGLILPRVATVSIEPARVARAVIGHLLAAEPVRRARHEELGGDMPEAMRHYFMSSDQALPPTIRLVAWPYPRETIVIGRGIGRLDYPPGEPIVADVVKFFPVAFAVLSVERQQPLYEFLEIRPELADAADTPINVELPFHGVPPAEWPEHPGASGIVLLNWERVIHATRKTATAP